MVGSIFTALCFKFSNFEYTVSTTAKMNLILLQSFMFPKYTDLTNFLNPTQKWEILPVSYLEVSILIWGRGSSNTDWGIQAARVNDTTQFSPTKDTGSFLCFILWKRGRTAMSSATYSPPRRQQTRPERACAGCRRGPSEAREENL